MVEGARTPRCCRVIECWTTMAVAAKSCMLKIGARLESMCLHGSASHDCRPWRPQSDMFGVLFYEVANLIFMADASRRAVFFKTGWAFGLAGIAHTGFCVLAPRRCAHSVPTRSWKRVLSLWSQTTLAHASCSKG